MNTLLHVDGLVKHYGACLVVDNVTFRLNKGEIGCLLGPSGCGKTTLLRCIAGFESISSGSITLDGKTVSGPQFVAPEHRRIGMVFQDYALFPHLTAAENVAFGLAGMSKAAQQPIVRTLLETVGLADVGSRYPHELSGGQQQRVALARALAPEPSLLLMDEPFSNLDVALRESLSAEIRAILKQRGITALMVTHNQNEAYAMADKIGVIACGRMHQWDSPHGVYHRPANETVAGFVGEGTLIQGMGTGETLTCALGTFRLPQATKAGAVSVLIRPEDIIHDDAAPMQAMILNQTFRGASILYTLQLHSGEEVLAEVPSHHNHAVGQHIGIRAELEDIVVFPASASLNADMECTAD